MSDTPLVPAGVTPPEIPAPVPAAVNWQEHIPTEYAGEKLWEPLKEKGLGDVLKGYAESQKLVGGSVRIPGPEATPEERMKFHRSLGVPEKSDAYDLGPQFANVPADAPLARGFKDMAHKAGLTPDQVRAVTNFYGETIGNAEGSRVQANMAGEKALRSEWGATYDFRAALAARAAQQAGGDAVVKLLDEYGLGSHPEIVKMFERLGREMQEDGAIQSDAQGIIGPKQALEKINAINADTKHPYWVADHQGHKAAVQEMANLRRIAHAE